MYLLFVELIYEAKLLALSQLFALIVLVNSAFCTACHINPINFRYSPDIPLSFSIITKNDLNVRMILIIIWYHLSQPLPINISMLTSHSFFFWSQVAKGNNLSTISRIFLVKDCWLIKPNVCILTAIFPVLGNKRARFFHNSYYMEKSLKFLTRIIACNLILTSEDYLIIKELKWVLD